MCSVVWVKKRAQEIKNCLKRKHTVQNYSMWRRKNLNTPPSQFEYVPPNVWRPRPALTEEIFRITKIILNIKNIDFEFLNETRINGLIVSNWRLNFLAVKKIDFFFGDSFYNAFSVYEWLNIFGHIIHIQFH